MSIYYVLATFHMFPHLLLRATWHGGWDSHFTNEKLRLWVGSWPKSVAKWGFESKHEVHEASQGHSSQGHAWRKWMLFITSHSLDPKIPAPPWKISWRDLFLSSESRLETRPGGKGAINKEKVLRLYTAFWRRQDQWPWKQPQTSAPSCIFPIPPSTLLLKPNI